MVEWGGGGGGCNMQNMEHYTIYLMLSLSGSLPAEEIYLALNNALTVHIVHVLYLIINNQSGYEPMN